MSRKLDRWIGEKIFGFTIIEMEDSGTLYTDKIGGSILPYYTVCMNAAFEAAAEFGLWRKVFLDQCNICRGRSEEMKHVLVDRKKAHWRDTWKAYLSMHDDPAVAICWAIYKLKTGNDWKD